MASSISSAARREQQLGVVAFAFWHDARGGLPGVLAGTFWALYPGVIPWRHTKLSVLARVKTCRRSPLIAFWNFPVSQVVLMYLLWLNQDISSFAVFKVTWKLF